MKIFRPIFFLWAFPNTLIGALFLIPTCLTGGKAKVVRGVLELHGGFTTTFLSRWTKVFMSNGASAMTLGHVVLGQNQHALDASREHERVHVRQCERWGPFFLPAYLISSITLWMSGGDLYWDNPFEKEAYNSCPERSGTKRSRRT